MCLVFAGGGERKNNTHQDFLKLETEWGTGEGRGIKKKKSVERGKKKEKNVNGGRRIIL